jgi:hypothetical protein
LLFQIRLGIGKLLVFMLGGNHDADNACRALARGWRADEN